MRPDVGLFRQPSTGGFACVSSCQVQGSISGVMGSMKRTMELILDGSSRC